MEIFTSTETMASPANSKIWSTFFVRSQLPVIRVLVRFWFLFNNMKIHISCDFERTKKADHILEMAGLVLFCD